MTPTDLNLIVSYDTVKEILKAGSELTKEVTTISKSLDHLIDIHGPIVVDLPNYALIEILGMAKSQIDVYLTQLTRVKKETANIELHLRGYFNLCNLAIKELKNE